jgi:hypothetical protein
MYQKSAGSENIQIQELGHYDPVGDKHLRSPIPPCEVIRSVGKLK